MQNSQKISPEQIFSGQTEYSEDQFRHDVLNIYKISNENSNSEASLNALINRILEDIKTNNEPDDLLKQFYQLFYYKFDLDNEEVKIVILRNDFQNMSLLTFYLYLVYASKLNYRYENGQLTKNQYLKIKKRYSESYIEFMEEWEIHKSLLDIAATS
ncbi:MAG: hypothetical protein KAH48_01900 [Chlorobi bacterium]|nr:hypothetical protein [Chlorobiota bacterium]